MNRSEPSRWLLRTLALATFLTLSSGCVIVDDRRGPYYDDPYFTDGPVYTTIDADEVLESELGKGVGLFVEYQTGGTWRLWTTCDTVYTGVACEFDIYALAGSSIRNISGEELEGYDTIDQPYNDEIVFYGETGADMDAVEFEADPGVDLQVELVLDGYVEPAFIFWVGNGRLHEGAPASPVVFEPATP